MADETYNGWPNRETWAANLWMGNDEGLDECMRRLVDEADGDERALADSLRDWWHERQDDAQESPAENAAMLPVLFEIGSLWRVDWRCLAAALLED